MGRRRTGTQVDGQPDHRRLSRHLVHDRPGPFGLRRQVFGRTGHLHHEAHPDGGLLARSGQNLLRLRRNPGRRPQIPALHGRLLRPQDGHAAPPRRSLRQGREQRARSARRPHDPARQGGLRLGIRRRTRQQTPGHPLPERQSLRHLGFRTHQRKHHGLSAGTLPPGRRLLPLLHALRRRAAALLPVEHRRHPLDRLPPDRLDHQRGRPTGSWLPSRRAPKANRDTTRSATSAARRSARPSTATSTATSIRARTSTTSSPKTGARRGPRPTARRSRFP